MKTTGNIEQLISFKSGKETFGLDVTDLKEVARMVSDCEKTEEGPNFLYGFIRFRGERTPLIDFAKLMNLDRKQDLSKEKLIALNLDGITVCLLVDSISGIIKCGSKNTIKPSDEEKVLGYCSVNLSKVTILDPKNIIDEDKLNEIKGLLKPVEV